MKTMMKRNQVVKLVGILMVVFFLLPSISYSQQPDTLVKKLDSLSQRSDSVKQNNTAPGAYNEITKLNVPSYFILLGSDLKQAFTKPFHMKGRDWKYLAIGAGTITALTFADPPIQRFALRLRNANSGLRRVSRTGTNFGGTYAFYTLGALAAYGYLFKSDKMQTTTLLATQSFITGMAVENVMKFLFGRTRPSFYDPNTIAKPTFKGPFAKSIDYTGAKTNSSFPSGHTTVAFAVATVYAMEYKNKPLIPILSYTSASLIGLSRMTENKHWFTDVLVGAALGYLSGRQVVNNYHRYAALKSPKKKGDLSFNLQYTNGVLMPGMVYRFR